MKCTICDKCKKIIEKPEGVRTIMCTRPIKKAGHCDDDRHEKPDHRPNDIIWMADLCFDCAQEVESFVLPPDEAAEE